MESIKELRKICQKPADRHDDYLDAQVWRRLSIYLTKLALYTPLKADHITMLMIFFGFVAGFLFSTGTFWCMLGGIIVSVFIIILDAVDGEIARYKKKPSLGGIFLDLVSHSTNMAVLFIGLTIALYRSNPSIYAILVGISACVFSVLCLNIQSMKHHVLFKELINRAQETERTKSRRINKKMVLEPTKKNTLKLVFNITNYLYNYNYITLIVFLAILSDNVYLVLLFYGLTFPIIWLIKLAHEYRIGYKPYEYLLEPYKK